MLFDGFFSVFFLEFEGLNLVVVLVVMSFVDFSFFIVSVWSFFSVRGGGGLSIMSVVVDGSIF